MSGAIHAFCRVLRRDKPAIDDVDSASTQDGLVKPIQSTCFQANSSTGAVFQAFIACKPRQWLSFSLPIQDAIGLCSYGVTPRLCIL